MSGEQIGTVFCKRIVGLPGERIEIIKGLVYINGKLLEETFEKISGDDNFPPMIVQMGEYFVLGDNRPNSLDSRYKEHSTVKRGDVLGQVMQIYSK